MGVELGKVLAKNILKQLDKPADVTGHDSSVRTHSPARPVPARRSNADLSPLQTTGLIHYYQKWRKE